jgi:transmembrane sensor
MDQFRITELIEKVHQNEASEAEIEELDSLYAQFDQKKGYVELLDKSEKSRLQGALYAKILTKLPTEPGSWKEEVSKPKLVLWRRIAAVAALLFILSSVAYQAHLNMGSKQPKQQIADIKPGGNNAILTLSNGKNIVLTNAKNGDLANENKVSVKKTADGRILYSKASGDGVVSAAFNTLTTPKGGQYTVTLSDGTLVYMNSASSLKFPVTFSNKERVVELSGEAYFEVSHNKQKPFKVMTNQQVVEVLGTHFNINSFGVDNSVKTVLEEGSVKVYSKTVAKLLKPGQQSIVKKDEIEVADADVEEALAWKNGYFRFNNESIKSVMPKLARWYDVEVVFDEQVTDVGFYGTISRSKNVREVLKMLEYTKGVHFKIEGRRITVMR